LIGSPIGGWVSDHAAAKHPRVPEARLLHNTLCTLVAMPVGLVLYGWALQRGAHLALIILAQVSCLVVQPFLSVHFVTSTAQAALLVLYGWALIVLAQVSCVVVQPFFTVHSHHVAWLVLYGWALQCGAHLALIILAQVCCSAGNWLGSTVIPQCASSPMFHGYCSGCLAGVCAWRGKPWCTEAHMLLCALFLTWS
jgi:hypothetical protein